MEETSNAYHAASSVAQLKKGRVQDLGRGSCSKNMSQSPRSVDPTGTTDISAPSPMENAPFGDEVSQLFLDACGSTHQPVNRKRKQSQFSSPSLIQRVARVQSLPMDKSVGSSRKQFAHGVPGTSVLTKTQKRNLRRRLKAERTKANLSNIAEGTGSGTQRPLPASLTLSTGVKVLQKKPRNHLHPCSFSGAVKTTKISIVGENFPTSKLSAENSALIQSAILQQMDSVLSDNLSLKIHKTILSKGALIVECGDADTVNWIRKCLDGDRKILGGEALKVISTDKLPKRKLCKVAFKVRNIVETDPKILLKRLQRLNEGLITEHWKVLHVSSEPNSSRWIFEVEESDVDTIRWFNLRAFSGLEYGVFKILYDPRMKKKSEESKSPEDDFSEETALNGPSSSQLDNLYLISSESIEKPPSIPGLTLLSGDD